LEKKWNIVFVFIIIIVIVVVVVVVVDDDDVADTADNVSHLPQHFSHLFSTAYVLFWLVLSMHALIIITKGKNGYHLWWTSFSFFVFLAVLGWPYQDTNNKW
jgi:Mn2+/Fe2+ NRAMP family transporter